MKTHTITEVLKALDAAISKHQHRQSRVAEAAGVRNAEVSDTVNRKRLPSKKLLAFLGYEARTVYVFAKKL